MSLQKRLRRSKRKRKKPRERRRTRRAPIKETSTLTTMVVDVVEEEDAATNSSNTPKDMATSKAVEEVEADLTIKVAVSVEEAVAMSNTFKVMQVLLQLTRLDSQDGNQDGIIITINLVTIMIKDHTTLIRDGIDNQLQRETVKASCLTQLQP